MRTLFAALLLTAVAAAQSFDQMLPDSTIVYVSLESITRTKERYDKSPLAAFWKDEAMQAFAEKPRAKWAEWMDELRKEEGMTPSDVLDVLAGQAAFALVWGEGFKKPKVLVLADIGENADKFQELVAKAEKQLLEEGRKRDEQEFRGVKIVTYRQGEETTGTSWLLDGKTFAMSEDADALKDLLARKDRKEGTLAARELYRPHLRRRGEPLQGPA
jgi:hypothetical protein